MKKLGFVLVMMLAIVSLLVVGCGGGDGEEATPTATESPGATATQSPTEQKPPGQQLQQPLPQHNHLAYWAIF